MDLLKQALAVLGNIPQNKVAQQALKVAFPITQLSERIYNPKTNTPFPNFIPETRKLFAEGLKTGKLPDYSTAQDSLSFAGMTGSAPLYRHSAKVWDNSVSKFMKGKTIPEIDSGIKYILQKAQKESGKPIQELLGKYSMNQLIDKIAKLVK